MILNDKLRRVQTQAKYAVFYFKVYPSIYLEELRTTQIDQDYTFHDRTREELNKQDNN
jgi:hypothetical protein